MDIPNLCMECNVDMGNCNPRQLCGKWRCLNEAFIDLSDTEDETINEQIDNNTNSTNNDTNSTNNDTKTNAEYCEEPETKKAKTNNE